MTSSKPSRNLACLKVDINHALADCRNSKKSSCMCADFDFSLGLDPDFSMTLPLDIPPFTHEDSTFFNNSNDNLLSPSNAEFPLNNMPDNVPTNDVLDDSEKQAFSTFLDSVLMDQDVPFTSSGAGSVFYPFPQQQESSPSFFPGLLVPPASTTISGTPQKEDEEERRQSAILKSLDEQKQLHLLAKANATPFPATVFASAPTADRRSTKSDPSLRADAVYLQDRNAVPASHVVGKKRANDHASQTKQQQPAAKRRRSERPLLSEEEKRANHIASEQKRRGAIRNGFNELTELIPALKNMHNSKSTVLFKAVDYIKYLEKRNKGLLDKVKSLEMRIKLEGRILIGPPTPEASNASSTISTSSNGSGSGSSSCCSSSISSSGSHPSSSVLGAYNESSQRLAPSTMAALLAHKSQQKQLLELQEPLQYHRRLLSQR